MYVSIQSLCPEAQNWAQVHPISTGGPWDLSAPLLKSTCGKFIWLDIIGKDTPVCKVLQLRVHVGAYTKGYRTFFDALKFPSSIAEPPGFALELAGHLNWPYSLRWPRTWYLSSVEKGEPSISAVASLQHVWSCPKGTWQTMTMKNRILWCDEIKSELLIVDARFHV